jgi:hypothetical protein
MKYNEFIKNIKFGDTTAFVYDSPNNRYTYASGEITEDIFNNISNETEFKICNINDLPDVKSVMVENFLAELEPAENVEDDGYTEIKRKLEAGNAKIGCWENDGNDVYMLIF